MARRMGTPAAFGAGLSCERQAIEQLVDIQRNGLDYARRDGLLAEDELFYAEQNAQVVRTAERYYRAMFSGRVTSGNLRDQHMAQTLEALLAHLDRYPELPSARIVVWAHNSHVGDARATESSADGQLTLGQLVRERYRGDCRLIGFSTYTGTVTTASEWGGVAERKLVRPALPGNIEELFHETGKTAFAVSPDGPAAAPLDVVRLSRAIGVIYLPAAERQSHYFHARPADHFDAMIHIENTQALEPLEVTSQWIAGETPETYPTGL
jgi:erythromycin esterase-like protein